MLNDRCYAVLIYLTKNLKSNIEFSNLLHSLIDIFKATNLSEKSRKLHHK